MKETATEQNIAVEIFKANCDVITEREADYVDECHWIAGPLFIAGLEIERVPPTETNQKLGVTIEDLAKQVKGHHYEIGNLPAYISRSNDMRSLAILYHGSRPIGKIDTEPVPHWTFFGCDEGESK